MPQASAVTIQNWPHGQWAAINLLKEHFNESDGFYSKKDATRAMTRTEAAALLYMIEEWDYALNGDDKIDDDSADPTTYVPPEQGEPERTTKKKTLIKWPHDEAVALFLLERDYKCVDRWISAKSDTHVMTEEEECALAYLVEERDYGWMPKSAVGASLKEATVTTGKWDVPVAHFIKTQPTITHAELEEPVCEVCKGKAFYLEEEWNDMTPCSKGCKPVDSARDLRVASVLIEALATTTHALANVLQKLPSSEWGHWKENLDDARDDLRNCRDVLALPAFKEAALGKPPFNAENLALDTTHRNAHVAADAFWSHWRKYGETHRKGYYESTWGAINQAIRTAGIRQQEYGKPIDPVTLTTFETPHVAFNEATKAQVAAVMLLTGNDTQKAAALIYLQGHMEDLK